MDIAAFLKAHDIPYEWFDHPAVFTCEESAKLPPMPGADTKNLFLREEKTHRFFLVTVGHDKRVDLKALRSVLETRPLSFGTAEELKARLGVEPGSVTLLGLLHDVDQHVTCILDEHLWAAEAIRCHPLVNTASVILSHSGLEKFFEVTRHMPRILNVPSK